MIYLDNAATTMMYDDAVNAMLPYLNNNYANASELYSFATGSRKAVNDARKTIAKTINSRAENIYFTSGGTESDNWAIAIAINDRPYESCHIITTSFEHNAILNTCRHYEEKGVKVTYINPDKNGLIDPADILKAIRKDTILISVMMCQNEIGTIQNVKEIGHIAREHNILFHTDAVAAYLHFPIDVNSMNIDLLSVSAHKCHGPKGTGFLYIRDRSKAVPFHFGGKQERLLRAGTENVPAIAAFGKAAEIGFMNLYRNMKYINGLKEYFIYKLNNELDGFRINGDLYNRAPGNINISFKNIDGEALQIQLDLYEICCSTGSACSAGGKAVSHVLKAIKVPPEYTQGTLRFTLSEFNTKEEIDTVIYALKAITAKLRHY